MNGLHSVKYKDLRDFIAVLEQRGELVRITTEVDPKLEMTEIADRTLRAGGPALLFENPKGFDTPVLANLFGTEQRVALGMGADQLSALREIGEILAYLRQPDPPKGMRDLADKAARETRRLARRARRGADRTGDRLADVVDKGRDRLQH